MSEFKRGNQRTNSNDRNKRPSRNGYDKREHENKPAIVMVDRFVEKITGIVNDVNGKTDYELDMSLGNSKMDFGQISVRIDYMQDGLCKKSVNFYFMENRRSRSGDYYNAFIMATHGSNGGVLFSTFGRSDVIIAKLIPYANSIIARNAGLDVDVATTKTE